MPVGGWVDLPIMRKDNFYLIDTPVGGTGKEPSQYPIRPTFRHPSLRQRYALRMNRPLMSNPEDAQLSRLANIYIALQVIFAIVLALIGIINLFSASNAWPSEAMALRINGFINLITAGVLIFLSLLTKAALGWALSLSNRLDLVRRQLDNR